MNKTKTSLIVLALLLCNLTASAYDFEVDGIYYNVLSASDRTVEVTHGNNEHTSAYKGHVVIPSKVLYNNIEFEVTAIGTEAFGFSNFTGSDSESFIINSDLVSVNLPEGITSIGDCAFQNCVSIASIALPQTLTSIGDYAFFGCKSIKSITFPQSLKSIGRYSFCDCKNLETINMSQNLKRIEEGAFANCPQIGYIRYNPEVDFASHSFVNSLKIMWLPVGVGPRHNYGYTDYNISAFGDIKAILEYGTYWNGPVWGVVDNTFEYEQAGWCTDKFIMYDPSLTETEITTILETGGEVVIDGVIYSITSLNETFAMEVCGCESGITTANIVPTINYINREFTVTGINESAFSNAKNLTSVTIPNSIGGIGKNVFAKCTSIKEVTVERSTPPVLKDGCFDAMTQLGATLYVPKGTVDDYKGADVWKGFGTIGEGPCTITYLVDDSIYAIEKVPYWTDLNLMEEPAKEGYTFSGWNGAPEKVSDEDITVEGSFTVNRYRLTYLLDSMEYSVDSIAYGTELVQKDSLFKEGYTFSGWSELPDSMPARDVTVEGKFTVNRYRLTYLLDSMEYSVDSIAYGTELVQKDSLFKEGHTFSGWSELPDSMPARDVTVEGSFTVNRYRLTYLLDSMEYSVDSIAYGTELVRKEMLEKEGHTFSGWSEIPTAMPAKDVTVEGTFTVNHYTLLYMVDGEVYASEEIAYGETIVLKEIPLKDGYAFSGWSEIPTKMPANDLTVTGTFTPLVYCDTPTISYDNGKLTFDCTTDGAECVANIVSDDFLEHIGNEMELTLTYQVNVYAKAEGHANSEVVTATICWIECDHQSGAHETTAIPATVVLIQSSNGIISIQGLEEGTSVSVYTTSGMEVVNGVAEENVVLILDTDLQKGEVAIVKMGTRTVKVVMK